MGTVGGSSSVTGCTTGLRDATPRGRPHGPDAGPTALGLPPLRHASILPELVLSSLGHGEYAQRGWARVGPERAITAVLHRAGSPDERPDSTAGRAMIRHNGPVHGPRAQRSEQQSG